VSEDVDVEKLAGVLNNTGQQGKGNFVRMLWNTQPGDVQSQLMPLLNAETRQAIASSSDGSEQEGSEQDSSEQQDT
jgi:hypothetical protein